jgi:hypothetical protein
VDRKTLGGKLRIDPPEREVEDNLRNSQVESFARRGRHFPTLLPRFCEHVRLAHRLFNMLTSQGSITSQHPDLLGHIDRTTGDPVIHN